ncbi:hypothetical protein LV513_001505, partial [Campylobacter jejuni]|nr:hypothetical protein [Campylobacter jejuni]MKJ70272.1 hypothetical protein [Campylobacter jejuni]
DKYLIKFSRFVFQNFDFNYIYLNNLIYINGCIRDPYSVLSKYSKYSKYKEIKLNSNFLFYVNDYINFLRYEKNKNDNTLNFVREYGLLSHRIKDHLSYKIGICILSSKTLLKKIILPFLIFMIVIYHKGRKKDKINLPAFQKYPDYDISVKLKKTAEYLIGEEFIKNMKQWYNGKILIFFLKILIKNK